MSARALISHLSDGECESLREAVRQAIASKEHEERSAGFTVPSAALSAWREIFVKIGGRS